MSLTIKYNQTTTKYDLIQRLEGTNIEIEVDSAPNAVQANQLYWSHWNYYKASADKWEAKLKVEALLKLQGIKSLGLNGHEIKSLPAPDRFTGIEDKGNNDEE